MRTYNSLLYLTWKSRIYLRSEFFDNIWVAVPDVMMISTRSSQGDVMQDWLRTTNRFYMS